jgi:3-phosphoshikimate 1-carboxyvinyltransferase
MANRLIIAPVKKIYGEVFVPGDKSISHRALLFSSLTKASSRIRGFLNGSDCLVTLQLIEQLGIQVNQVSATEIILKSPGFLLEPSDVLDCQNSGTTIRLLAGLLAGQPFFSVLTGSEQIRRRPMGRVLQPLQKMGAQIHSRKADTMAPIAIDPVPFLMGKTHEPMVASAQIKSCILLAGLFAEGETSVTEPGPARDHSERMLKAMGAPIQVNGNTVRIRRPNHALQPINIIVPGDISSAAFLIVAACIVEDSHVILKNIGINPTRNGIIQALQQMGAAITLHDVREESGEPVADIEIKYAPLAAITLGGEIVVRMIDELPILAVAATQARGATIIKDAAELKVKETNRIDTTVQELRKMGAYIEATDDGFTIEGPTKLHGAVLDSHGDHRLAMMAAIAGLCAQNNTEVLNANVIKDSFPGFADCLRSIGAIIKEN